MIVTAAHPSDYDWIAQRAALVVGPQFRAIKAVDGSGRIHGMVGYDSWTQNAVSMHVAVDTPTALRSLIPPAFRIPFLEFGLGVALATVLSTNTRSLALVRKLGFHEAVRLQEAWAKDVDMIIFHMRREDCRWLTRKKEAA